MLKKRGGTHIGFVLSFVIFITFLIFLYSIIIEPTRTSQDKQFVLDRFKLNIINETTVNDFTTLTIEYIGTAENPIKDCIKFNVKGFEGIEDAISATEGALVIKNETNDLLNYTLQGAGDKLMQIGPLNSDQDAFLKIFYSTSLENPRDLELTGCKGVSEGTDIIVRQIKIETQILETEIINLIGEFELSYDSLKDKLDIPPETEFTFSFEYDNGTIIEPTGITIPSSVNVYSEEFFIQYIDKESNTLLGILRIKVW